MITASRRDAERSVLVESKTPWCSNIAVEYVGRADGRDIDRSIASDVRCLRVPSGWPKRAGGAARKNSRSHRGTALPRLVPKQKDKSE